FRSRSAFNTISAGKSTFATLPIGVMRAPSRSLPLKALQTERACRIEAAGANTRIRSARYFCRARGVSAFASQNLPFIPGASPPDRNTFAALLCASHTPELKRSGVVVVFAGFECGGNEGAC